MLINKYRDELLPNETYRRIWQQLDAREARDVAPKIMLRLLKLAADYDCEDALGQKALTYLDNELSLDINALECEFNQMPPPLPHVDCQQHTLKRYDYYIGATYAAL